jgi:hypothetical protein
MYNGSNIHGVFMNPILSMQVRLGMLESHIHNKEDTAAFTSVFKTEDNLELQNQRISEAVENLLLDSNGDALVEKLATDWDTIKEKMKSGTCGEIRNDLNAVIKDVKDIYKNRTDSLSSSTYSPPSSSVVYNPTETQFAHEIQHQVQRKEAIEVALEKHPHTFEMFMRMLNRIREGEFGEKMTSALAERDIALFNMQTLLILSFWDSDPIVLDETFNTYLSTNPAEVAKLKQEIKAKGSELLENILFLEEASLNQAEANFKNRLNALISHSDMEYKLAQSILEYGGKKVGELEDGNIEELPITSDEIEQSDVPALEDLIRALQSIIQLPEEQRKEELCELAEFYIEEGNYEFVGVIFDAMNEAGHQQTVYLTCLNLLPIDRQITPEVFDKMDALDELKEKVQNPVDREMLRIGFLGVVLRAAPHPTMHHLVDRKILAILDEAEGATLEEGIAQAAIYYASKRNEVDHAANILTTYIQGDKMDVLSKIEKFWHHEVQIRPPKWWNELNSHLHKFQ